MAEVYQYHYIGSSISSLLSIQDSIKDPPPAYTFEEISRPPSSILTGISSATLTFDTASLPGSTFPTSFNLYFVKASLPNVYLHLGEHGNDPCRAVTMTFSWKGSSLTLHSGPAALSSPLATASAENLWNRHSNIMLASSGGDMAITFPSISYTFSLPINNTIETFEWRLSHGNEVKTLDDRALGWKLVRLHSTTILPGGKRKERPMGETSDGKEVVAVWADNSKMCKKCGKFRFLGAGATGEFGEKWSVMAVVTVLRIWQNIRLGTDARRVLV